MKILLQTFSLAVSAGLAMAAHAAEDTFRLSTINPPAGSTDCRENFFGDILGKRFAMVRGRPNHTIRIEKNLIDVGLERASVANCSACDVTITRKGNFDSGRNGFLADRKGFVELEVNTPANTPTGDTNLILHYLGGGRGEYKLLIVRNSRVDSIEAVGVSNPSERVRLHGNNLDRLANNFSDFTRVSESDATITLALVNRVCRARTAELDLVVDGAQSCRIRDVRIPLARDPACPAEGNNPPPPPANPLPPPAPPRAQAPTTPNLLPALASPTVLTRPLGAVVTTTRGGMLPVNSFFCSGLAANTPSTVNVPKLTWGVSGVNIEAATGPNARFDVQLIDVDANNRVLDTLTLPQGFPANTPLLQRDNYPGRATTIRVVMNPRFQVGTGQQTFAGCFTDPDTTPTLDSRNLLIKVDPDNRIVESNEKDNELRF